MSDLLHKTSVQESSFDAQDSHFFLRSLQFEKQWYSYSSKDRSLEDVVSAIETYILLHATIDFPNKGFVKFWTPKPLGSFRYVMDQNGDWHDVSIFDPHPGYTVQGSYWQNGFYYLVSHDDFLLEANLFVDYATKNSYNYL